VAPLIHTPDGTPVLPWNRWDLLPENPPALSLGGINPHLRATVVIPSRNGATDLARTLTALSASSYPRHLLEVLVVDDHSDPPLDPPTDIDGLSITRIPNRPHQVFGAGIARCTGAAASTADVLFFLDADIICDHDLISRHMAWHHCLPYALVSDEILFADVGSLSDSEFAAALRNKALADLLAGRIFEGQEWRRNRFLKSRYHTVDAPDLFASTVGALVSVHRHTYEALGGFRELGIRGIEDLEFGYRAHNAGALLIADSGALCWHQGPRTISTNRAQILAARAAVMKDLIPVPGFRGEQDSGSQSVPLLQWVTAESEASAVDLVSGLVSRLLSLQNEIAMRQAAAAVTLYGSVSTDWHSDRRSDVNISRWMLEEGIGVLHLIDSSTRTEVATVVRTRAIARSLLAGITEPGEALSAASTLFGERWVSIDEAGLRRTASQNA
jgi:GT2 family glycosyltransferase